MFPTRVLSLPNALNLRELGGYPAGERFIAWHKLLRSGTLGHLDRSAGVELAGYGVSTVVDLRTRGEQTTRPDQLPRTVRYRPMSVYPFADHYGRFTKAGRRLRRATRTGNTMTTTYVQMLMDTHARQVFADLFAILLATTGPRQAVLFHCTAGKDRTGVAAIMIEAALGVPAATQREDYLLTNLVLERPGEFAHADLTQGASAFVNQMNAHTAEVANFTAVQDFVTTNYGAWPAYLHQALGLSAQDLTDLRQLYLTDSPEPR